MNSGKRLSCTQHNQEIKFLCCVSEWHTEALCQECVTDHVNSHLGKQQKAQLNDFSKALSQCQEKDKQFRTQLSQLESQIGKRMEVVLDDRDENLDKIREWKNQVLDEVEQYFKMLENWYRKILDQLLQEKKGDFNEVYVKVKTELEDIDKRSKLNLDSDLKDSLEYIKAIYYKQQEQKTELLTSQFNASDQKRIDQPLVLNQPIFESIKSNLKQLILKGGLDETGKPKKDTQKEKQHYCPKCGSKMIFLTDFKKHLCCPKCQNVKRGFGTKQEVEFKPKSTFQSQINKRPSMSSHQDPESSNQ